MSLLRTAVSLAREAGRAPHFRVHVLRPRNGVRPLWPPFAAHADESSLRVRVFAHRRSVRASLFGCHLRPHDAPARTCAYWCRNHTKAVARPVPSLDLGPTAGGHLCQCFAHRRPAQRLPALGLGNFDIKSLEILFRYPTAFEFRVIIAGLGEDLKQVCDMNFGYCWFWSPLPVQASELRRPTSPTTRSPSFWCLRWHRVLDRGRCRRLKITVEDHGLDLCRRHRSTIGSGSPAAPHIGGMLRKTPFAPTR